MKLTKITPLEQKKERKNVHHGTFKILTFLALSAYWLTLLRKRGRRREGGDRNRKREVGERHVLPG